MKTRGGDLEEISFKVVSASTGELYTVQFFRDGTQVTAFCTCPSGENGGVCKHRLLILEGNDVNVEENANLVSVVASWLPSSNLSAVLDEVATAENNVKRAKKELSAVKKMLARAMNGGR